MVSRTKIDNKWKKNYGIQTYVFKELKTTCTFHNICPSINNKHTCIYKDKKTTFWRHFFQVPTCSPLSLTDGVSAASRAWNSCGDMSFQSLISRLSKRVPQLRAAAARDCWYLLSSAASAKANNCKEINKFFRLVWFWSDSLLTHWGLVARVHLQQLALV